MLVSVLSKAMMLLKERRVKNMTQAQHTQGPWKAQGARVAKIHIHKSRGHEFTTEIIDCGPKFNGFTPRSEQEANARLIAAAPELLEALEESLSALEYVADIRGINGDNVTLSKIRTAIAKATVAA